MQENANKQVVAPGACTLYIVVSMTDGTITIDFPRANTIFWNVVSVGMDFLFSIKQANFRHVFISSQSIIL